MMTNPIKIMKYPYCNIFVLSSNLSSYRYNAPLALYAFDRPIRYFFQLLSKSISTLNREKEKKRIFLLFFSEIVCGCRDFEEYRLCSFAVTHSQTLRTIRISSHIGTTYFLFVLWKIILDFILSKSNQSISCCPKCNPINCRFRSTTKRVSLLVRNSLFRKIRKNHFRNQFTHSGIQCEAIILSLLPFGVCHEMWNAVSLIIKCAWSVWGGRYLSFFHIKSITRVRHSSYAKPFHLCCCCCWWFRENLLSSSSFGCAACSLYTGTCFHSLTSSVA